MSFCDSADPLSYQAQVLQFTDQDVHRMHNTPTFRLTHRTADLNESGADHAVVVCLHASF